MKFLILHLSDIHIKREEGTNIALNRIEKIKNVVNKHARDISACFIVVSGDVVFSGNSKEYSIATEFFDNLQKQVESINNSIDVKYVIVPGNHDCNFENVNNLRKAAIQWVLENVSDDATINECTSVQKDFYEFLGPFSEITDFQDIARIYCKRDFMVGDYVIRFNCYNTAWMSQKREKQGQIVFPIDLIETDNDKFDLVLSVFHHTYNWFKSDNGKEFKKRLEQTSDIILTGHEHDLGQTIQKKITGEITEYIEGGALQQDTSKNSEFNVLIVDLEEAKQKLIQYEWKGDMYCEKNSTDWFSFVRNIFLQKHEFINNDEFGSDLNDPGATFTHSKQGKLNLNHIFIYPDLKEFDLESSSGKLPYKIIKGESLIDYVTNNKKLVIVGANKSGKTTLAKKIYTELSTRGIVPILMAGSLIKANKEEKYLNLINETFSDQYTTRLLERYHQLGRDKKVILIDNFGEAKLNRKGKTHFINILKKVADMIILFDDTLFMYTEFIQLHQEGESNPLPFLEFKICSILPFGHLLRTRMITRWLTLGQEFEIDEIDLLYKIDAIEYTINAIIKRHLLPSYPIFILTILQTFEANLPLKTVLGSYGYFYELLITQALAEVSDKPDLDLKYTYLSQLAYYKFCKNLDELTNLDIDNINQRYHNLYAKHIPKEKMMKDLTKSQILTKFNGSYKFRYNYIYYYFVARYMRDNMQVPEDEATIKGQIKEISKSVFKEDCANIMIFLSYLSKNNPFILGEMLRNAKEVYKNYGLCDLEKDVEFATKLSTASPQVVLVDKDVKKTREEYLKIQDVLETVKNNQTSTFESQEEVEEDEFLKVNLAFKNLEILGQITRNFSASLRADAKSNLVEECYLLGLRTLKFLVSLIKDNLDTVKNEFSALLKTRRQFKDDKELEKKIDAALFLFLQIICCGMIKKISYSVGSQDLEEIYRKILDKYDLKSVSLIDISIKLDHFRDIPVNDIIRFYAEIKNNLFPATTLKYLLVIHFYMFPVSYDIRQKLCNSLKISVKDPKLIDSSLRIIKHE